MPIDISVIGLIIHGDAVNKVEGVYNSAQNECENDEGATGRSIGTHGSARRTLRGGLMGLVLD